MKLSHQSAVCTMVLVTFLWATAGVVTRHLDSVRSFELTFWRSLFAFAALALFVGLQGGTRPFTALRHQGRAFWVSAVCWCGMFTFYMVALTLTTVANVLVVMSIGPLVTALMAWAFIGHRVPPRTWVAIAVSGVAMAWMFWGQASGMSLVATLVTLGVPLCGALNWTVTQHAYRQPAQSVQNAPNRAGKEPSASPVDLVPAVMLGALLSCLVTLPLAWPLQSTWHDVRLLAGLGLGQLAVPCMLAVWCTRRLAAPEISLLAMLETVFGIALAWVGAGEAPAANVLVGGVVVMATLAVNEWLGWRDSGKKPVTD